MNSGKGIQKQGAGIDISDQTDTELAAAGQEQGDSERAAAAHWSALARTQYLSRSGRCWQQTSPMIGTWTGRRAGCASASGSLSWPKTPTSRSLSG